MDLHVPHGPIASLKDFLLHIGIVTIGILIALGLEQVVEAVHRAHLAAEAVDGFRRELADDRKQLQEVVAAMPALRSDIDAEIARLTTPPVNDGKPRLPIKYPGVKLDLVQHASWEAAVATQALGELPYESVNRFAQAYDAFRLFEDEERTGLTQWHELHRFGDDRAALTPEQTQALVERLRAYRHTAETIEWLGNHTIEICDQTLAVG